MYKYTFCFVIQKTEGEYRVITDGLCCVQLNAQRPKNKSYNHMIYRWQQRRVIEEVWPERPSIYAFNAAVTIKSLYFVI